jgi:hypothetical protein
MIRFSFPKIPGISIGDFHTSPFYHRKGRRSRAEEKKRRNSRITKKGKARCPAKALFRAILP